MRRAIDGVTVLGPDLCITTAMPVCAACVCSRRRDGATIGRPPTGAAAVAVINCTGGGRERTHRPGSQVERVDRHVPGRTVAAAGSGPNNSDIYVEVIGGTNNATDEGAVQLVKKSVPYLIE